MQISRTVISIASTSYHAYFRQLQQTSSETFPHLHFQSYYHIDSALIHGYLKSIDSLPTTCIDSILTLDTEPNHAFPF
jgi:hypothetical protein